MALSVITIVNEPLSSNCYILYRENAAGCVIVDPACVDATLIVSELDKLEIVPVYVVLTHEHFDHIWSVNGLRAKYPNLKVVCSKICSEAIQNNKSNLSLFRDGVGFEVEAADIVFEDGLELLFEDEVFCLFETKGHSEGSICVYAQKCNALFSGDTLIPGLKTVTKLKGGSRDALAVSFMMIEQKYRGLNPMVYPGHNMPKRLNEIKIIQ